MTRLLRLRSAWGLSGLRSGDRRCLFAKLRSAGWDGVEGSLHDIGGDSIERRACCEAAVAEGVSLVLSAYSSWHSYVGPYEATLSVESHAGALVSELREIAELSSGFAGGLSPILRVNAHSGTDAWTDAEAQDYFEVVQAEASAIGSTALPPVSHETHRGRFLCCPFATARMLSAVPSLRLTSDFSHWIIKCERLLDTAEERALLDGIVAPAVDHIHARIGTAQVSQVAHPCHVAVALAAARHYAWWQSVWTARERLSFSGRDNTLTATVEYGPVEIDTTGEYVGYTPVSLGYEPVSGLSHDALLATSRDALDESFERWHGFCAAQRRGV